MSDIMSSGCENVDQVIVDSLVESCNKILLDAASESEMFITAKQKNRRVKKVKKNNNPGLIKIVSLNVKSTLKREI